MKKKIFSLSAIFVATLLLSAIFAQAYSLPTERRCELLVDNAQVLDSDEKERLVEMLNEISDRQMTDIAVVTVDSTYGENITAFADDFYDENGFGYGAEKDGILLLLSMDERDWALTTCGAAIDIFTDYRLNCIMNESDVLSYLGNNEFFSAFCAFAAECDAWINVYKNSGIVSENEDVFAGDYNLPAGYENDSNFSQQSESYPLLKILVCVAAGFAVAFVALKIISSPLKSVKSKDGAADYMVGAAQITAARDVFLYSSVSKVPINTESSNGGGGSSTHRSSSGTMHGGSRGKF